jgi:hypothetical protein
LMQSMSNAIDIQLSVCLVNKEAQDTAKIEKVMTS